MQDFDLSDIVISSRIRLARNFKNIPFPRLLKDERAFNVFKDVFSAVKDAGDFNFFEMNRLSEDEKGMLVEKHLVSTALAKSRFGGVILNGNETVSIMLNEEDHIREQCFINGFNLKLAYNKLSKIDDKILEFCDIAYDGELGFLTACPTNLGTGLRASCMLFLPALTLTGGIGSVIAECRAKKQTIRGCYGEGSSASGFLYQISNQATLGKSEWGIIEEVENTIYMVAKKELDASLSFSKSEKEELENKAKSYVKDLTSGNAITIDALMEKAGIIKLFLYFNKDKCKNPEVLDQLISVTKPCSLKEISLGKITGKNIDEFRGEYLKKILQNVIQI